ncbi:hypothetical protein V8C86DRAFT_3143733 [Haematococcus lacustris]
MPAAFPPPRSRSACGARGACEALGKTAPGPSSGTWDCGGEQQLGVGALQGGGGGQGEGSRGEGQAAWLSCMALGPGDEDSGGGAAATGSKEQGQAVQVEEASRQAGAAMQPADVTAFVMAAGGTAAWQPQPPHLPGNSPWGTLASGPPPPAQLEQGEGVTQHKQSKEQPSPPPYPPPSLSLAHPNWPAAAPPPPSRPPSTGAARLGVGVGGSGRVAQPPPLKPPPGPSLCLQGAGEVAARAEAAVQRLPAWIQQELAALQASKGGGPRGGAQPGLRSGALPVPPGPQAGCGSLRQAGGRAELGGAEPVLAGSSRGVRAGAHTGSQATGAMGPGAGTVRGQRHVSGSGGGEQQQGCSQRETDSRVWQEWGIPGQHGGGNRHAGGTHGGVEERQGRGKEAREEGAGGQQERGGGPAHACDQEVAALMAQAAVLCIPSPSLAPHPSPTTTSTGWPLLQGEHKAPLSSSPLPPPPHPPPSPTAHLPSPAQLLSPSPDPTLTQQVTPCPGPGFTACWPPSRQGPPEGLAHAGQLQPSPGAGEGGQRGPHCLWTTEWVPGPRRRPGSASPAPAPAGPQSRACRRPSSPAGQQRQWGGQGQGEGGPGVGVRGDPGALVGRPAGEVRGCTPPPSAPVRLNRTALLRLQGALGQEEGAGGLPGVHRGAWCMQPGGEGERVRLMLKKLSDFVATVPDV